MASCVLEHRVNDPCIFWILAPELAFSILAFVDGKALSCFVEALMASKSKRVLLGPLVGYLTKRWHHEIHCLLSGVNRNSMVTIAAPSTSQPALLAFVRETMMPKTETMLSMQDCSVMIRIFSEWCILLDYVLQGPRSASSADRMVWPVGVGVFATTARYVPLRSKVVLHCPIWKPQVIVLCQDIWLSDSQSQKVGAPTHFSWLPSEGDLDGFNPDANIGILTPLDDTNTRTFQGTQALTTNDDFLHGMGRPDSCLSILPSLDCPIYGSFVEQMVRSSCRHSWMLEAQRLNQLQNKPSMLCFYDSHHKYSQAVEFNHNQSSLEHRIFQIMKACQKVIR
jgi:hypothetical protein